jgi:hypothetical protein
MFGNSEFVALLLELMNAFYGIENVEVFVRASFSVLKGRVKD